jgi:prephenate dehydrogenase
VRWNKITIIGVGLLGGSLGMTLRGRRLARQVVGLVRRAASVAESKQAQAVDVATLDVKAAVANADLIVLCTPLGQMRSLVRQMLPAVKRGAIVTDVGSVKTSVVKELEPLVAKAGAHFVGSHPMAGAEKTGVSAARPDLFADAVCVVTPTRKTNKAAWHRVERFWRSVGGRVLTLSPETHDKLVSRSSHLPHIIAATLATSVLNPALPKHQGSVCANGFRDTTRIASGSPEMWRDIAISNRRNLTKALKSYAAQLQKVQKLIDRGDAAAVTKFLETAKKRRDYWRARCASPSSE